MFLSSPLALRGSSYGDYRLSGIYLPSTGSNAGALFPYPSGLRPARVAQCLYQNLERVDRNRTVVMSLEDSGPTIGRYPLETFPLSQLPLSKISTTRMVGHLGLEPRISCSQGRRVKPFPKCPLQNKSGEPFPIRRCSFVRSL